jgi:hypothetical protein
MTSQHARLSLLEAYPDAGELTDDELNTPLHLALEKKGDGSTEHVGFGLGVVHRNLLVDRVIQHTAGDSCSAGKGGGGSGSGGGGDPYDEDDEIEEMRCSPLQGNCGAILATLAVHPSTARVHNRAGKTLLHLAMANGGPPGIVAAVLRANPRARCTVILLECVPCSMRFDLTLAEVRKPSAWRLAVHPLTVGTCLVTSHHCRQQN